MKIPFFDLSRQYQELREEVLQRVTEVMDSGQYIEGSAVRELENELKEYLGVSHVITCGNGTDALRIALQAAGIKSGDEVITSAFSFFATPEAIGQIGAIPVFADINKNDYNLDPDSVKEKITKKTKAILPVHIFGMPADMDEINKIAKERGLLVIEDACQAIGSTYQGKPAGTIGDMGCFSFYPTKNLGAFGDGGMIATDSEEFAVACRALKSHGAGKLGARARSFLHAESVEELHVFDQNGNGLYDPYKYYNYLIGGNSRLDSMQAAVLLVKLKSLDEYNKKRNEIAKAYTAGLSGLPLKLPVIETNQKKSCFHQYAVLSQDKEGLLSYLEQNGIGAGAFYPVPLHRQKAFANGDVAQAALPVAEEICAQSVCLPLYPELKEEEVQKVIETIKNYYR